MTLLILALLGGLALGIFAKARLSVHPLIAAALFAVVVQIVGWLVYGPDKDGHFNALYGFLEAAAGAFAVIMGSAVASLKQGTKESE
jgi:hypothetical protein